MKAFFNALFSCLFFLALASCQSGGGSSATQPCSEKSVGDSCGGGLFAGNFDDYSLIVAPGNCTDSSTPTCDGSADAMTKQWATNAAVTSNAIDDDDGKSNTTTIVNTYAPLSGNEARAALFCHDLNYQGYTDWYLPSRNELLQLATHKVALGGFKEGGSDYYWSSTEASDSAAYRVTFSTGTSSTTSKNATYYIRCVRQDD